MVELTLDAERAGETVSFSGTTNLPDGTVLTWLIDYLNADGSVAWGTESTVFVHDRRFEGEPGVDSWPIRLRVVFQMDLGPEGQQPAEAVERYGESGEKMEGDRVMDGASYWDPDPPGRHAEIATTVE